MLVIEYVRLKKVESKLCMRILLLEISVLVLVVNFGAIPVLNTLGLIPDFLTFGHILVSIKFNQLIQILIIIKIIKQYLKYAYYMCLEALTAIIQNK